MREIKFRGKRIDNGEWVYGFYGELNNGEITKSYIMVSTLTFVPNTHVYFTDYEVDPETVGQFVELKDVNGKEIFEDDLIEFEGLRFHIRWGVNSNGYIAQTNSAHSNVYSSYHVVRKSKWIGTIHDNPELMGVKA